MTPASRAASAVATKAIDLPVPTYEASVSCGSYCQGGSVSFDATTYPEYTDLWQVWVKGTDVAALASSHADLLAALAAMLRDFGFDGCGGTFEDGEHSTIDAARAAIAKAKGLAPQEQQK